MGRGMQQPTRFVALVGALLVALILVTAFVVLLVERRGPPHYPPDSPEAAIVVYVDALRAGDTERVRTMLSTRARQELERRERLEAYYDFEAELRGASESLREARIRIDRVQHRDGRVTATLTIERTASDIQPGFPFPSVGGGTFRYQRTLSLVREDGAWKVDELAFYL